MSLRLKQRTINTFRLLKLRFKAIVDNAQIGRWIMTTMRTTMLARRVGASSTGMVLAVLMVALIAGGIVGIFLTGFLSFAQPWAPFLFQPVTIINYTLVPIGFVVTSLATLPILVYLLAKTHQEI